MATIDINVNQIASQLSKKANINLDNVLPASYTTLLEVLYPIGSLYFGTQETCPLTILLPDSTWELVATDRSIQGSSTTHTAGSTIEAGLPNITGSATIMGNGGEGSNINVKTASGAFYRIAHPGAKDGYTSGANNNGYGDLGLDASLSSNVYGGSPTVQPPAYIVNVWKRTL